MKHIDAYAPPHDSTLFFGVTVTAPLSQAYVDRATLYFAHARLDQVPWKANQYAMALIGEFNRARQPKPAPARKAKRKAVRRDR